jgi:hypothetical protein
MTGRMLSRCLAILAIAVMAAPLWAATSSIRKDIDITNKTEVNGKMLQPGNYELVVNGNQAKFEKNGKIVADAPCKWTPLKTTSQYDALLYNKNMLTGIQFQGRNQAISFMGSPASGQR